MGLDPLFLHLVFELWFVGFIIVIIAMVISSWVTKKREKMVNKKREKMVKLTDNFWYAKDPPDNDFLKEIVEPGTNETFPQGAVGIRVDDDFWAVAALPYKYKDIPIEEIVAEFWPDYVRTTPNNVL